MYRLCLISKANSSTCSGTLTDLQEYMRSQPLLKVEDKVLVEKDGFIGAVSVTDTGLDINHILSEVGYAVDKKREFITDFYKGAKVLTGSDGLDVFEDIWNRASSRNVSKAPNVFILKYDTFSESFTQLYENRPMLVSQVMTAFENGADKVVVLYPGHVLELSLEGSVAMAKSEIGWVLDALVMDTAVKAPFEIQCLKYTLRRDDNKRVFTSMLLEVANA